MAEIAIIKKDIEFCELKMGDKVIINSCVNNLYNVEHNSKIYENIPGEFLLFHKNMIISNLFSDEFKSTQVLVPLDITWDPKEDITTFELAKAIPLLTSNGYIFPNQLNMKESYLRHFKIIDPNKS